MLEERARERLSILASEQRIADEEESEGFKLMNG